jgi:hypothetical protein
VNNLLREKIQIYFREIDSENICAKNMENEEIVHLELGRFMRYL